MKRSPRHTVSGQKVRRRIAVECYFINYFFLNVIIFCQISAYTVDSPIPRREIWVHKEGCTQMRLYLEPHQTIIEDIKILVLRDSRWDYQAFHFQQSLDEEDPIPTDASSANPIQFKHIMNCPRESFFLWCCILKKQRRFATPFNPVYFTLCRKSRSLDLGQYFL